MPVAQGAGRLRLVLGGQQLSPGADAALLLYMAPGQRLTTQGSATRASCAACFGSLTNSFAANVTFSRGDARAYLLAQPGTSMATPLTAGLALQVRQYFSSGYYPGGRPSAAAGFAPSGALMKAVLINSATALADAAFAAYFSPGEPVPTAALLGMGGFGVPNLVRGLSFAALGPATRAAGQLPTLLLPGLTLVPANASGQVPPFVGVDPSVGDGGLDTYCIDTAPVAGALGAREAEGGDAAVVPHPGRATHRDTGTVPRAG